MSYRARRSISATGTVTLTVTAVNDAPVAVDDTVVTVEDTMLTTGDVLANDTDVEGESLSVVGFTQAEHGTVVANGDNSFTYTPNADFHGQDNFTYVVSDGQGGSATGTVVVTVTGIPIQRCTNVQEMF